MLALTLACVLVVASAAPQYHRHHGHRSFTRSSDMSLFDDDVFDTASFWLGLQTELQEMEHMLASFHSVFNVVTGSAGVEGNQYRVKLQLTGFDEKDVVVKAREGTLMVQAVHKYEDGISERNYVDVRTLPSNVDPAGNWGFNNGVLIINFPLKQTSTEAVTETTLPETTELVTVEPDVSREEITLRRSHEGDADIGVNQDTELATNEIKQTVEATTYAVDLNDEYEFVPVHYKK